MKSRYGDQLPSILLAHKLISFQNPVKSLRKYAFLALFIVYILYILANVAYFAAGECIMIIDR